MTQTLSSVVPHDGGSVLMTPAQGAQERVGSFCYYFGDERWEWSAEVAQMHGYGAVAMSPTTEQVLSHGYPGRAEQSAADFVVYRRDCSAFRAPRCIVDTHGRVRDVIVAGGQLRDEAGVVVGTHGFYVDVSPHEDVIRSRVTEALAAIAEDRAVIEQAKGMLGVVYGITADAAFDVLRWRSQATNTKLKLIARQLVADFRSASTHALPLQSAYDRLLITAHERVA